MKALLFEKKEIRYGLARAVSQLSNSKSINVAPLKLMDLDPLEKPASTEGWLKIKPRLSGICGSDLSTLSGHSSRYFESVVSFPFIMGHEIVADTETDSKRVVLDAVLGHQARGVAPPHAPNNTSDTDYGYLVSGNLEPGMQTGLCNSTGGGWGEELWAHTSQLHNVPDDFSDEAGVLVEPVASGIHSALMAKIQDGDMAVVIGAGTIGLAVVAALRKYTSVDKILLAAKYSHQQQLGKELGADEVVAPDQIIRLTRKMKGCQMLGDYLSSGADVVIDAVGSTSSLKTAMKLTRPRGRLIVCGMPGSCLLDLAPLWHREVELCGAYAYGQEHEYSQAQKLSEPIHTFDLAFEIIKDHKLERLVSATYPLKDYKKAIGHAFEAGKRGDSKVAFELNS